MFFENAQQALLLFLGRHPLLRRHLSIPPERKKTRFVGISINFFGSDVWCPVCARPAARRPETPARGEDEEARDVVSIPALGVCAPHGLQVRRAARWSETSGAGAGQRCPRPGPGAPLRPRRRWRVVGRMRACWAVAREEATGRGSFAVWAVFFPLRRFFLRASRFWLCCLVPGLYEIIQYTLSLEVIQCTLSLCTRSFNTSSLCKSDGEPLLTTADAVHKHGLSYVFELARRCCLLS